MSFFSIGSGRAFRLIDGTSLSPRSSVTCHISSKVLEKVPRLGHSRCRKQTDVRIFQNERRTCSLISSRLRQQKPDRQDENDISERTHLALSDNTYRYYAATIRSLFFFFVLTPSLFNPHHRHPRSRLYHTEAYSNLSRQVGRVPVNLRQPSCLSRGASNPAPLVKVSKNFDFFSPCMIPRYPQAHNPRSSRSCASIAEASGKRREISNSNGTGRLQRKRSY